MELKIFVAVFATLFSISFADDRTRPSNSIDDLREHFGDVIYAQILFRHGDRTSYGFYPTDPNQSFHWEEGNLQLTEVGKLRAYELGKWARQHYARLIAGRPYRYDVLLVNSSDADRTLMSAELFLAGMYPPSDEEMWNSENLDWQPIPIHTRPQSSDNILSDDPPCKRYDVERDALNKSPEVITFYKEHRDLFEYVSAHSEVKMSEDNILEAITNLTNIYDDLFVEAENNLTIPIWAQKVFPQPMKSVVDFESSLLAPTVEMQRLKGGPLLKSMVDDIREKADNSLESSIFHIYSAHSETIVYLLETLGIFNKIKPPYSAAVIVELRKKEENIYFVSVLYRNSSLAAPYTPYRLKIPGCRDDACTLDEFIRVAVSKIPDNWEYECEVALFTKLFYNFSTVHFVAVGVLFLTLVVVLVKVTIPSIQYFGRRYKHYCLTIRRQNPHPTDEETTSV